MTFEECYSTLTSIRVRQGTRRPLVRVDYAGTVIRGRLARTDCDPGAPHDERSPYGVLVLENLGLSRLPETILQIADIPDGGLNPLED
ncbi:MAG: hypothetical protein P4L84_19310 [Isosphaeraceae bacterium]|nr:hypothetical protein [Isosphaeraceae bacterium]